jgi:hypothetical protein
MPFWQEHKDSGETSVRKYGTAAKIVALVVALLTLLPGLPKLAQADDAASCSAPSATAPATSAVYRDLTYNISLSKEASAKPDVKITLDSNLKLNEGSVPTDATNGPITSYDYDDASKTVTLHLGGSQQAVQFSFGVTPINTANADSSTVYNSTVEACGKKIPLSTQVTGDLKYSVSKSYEVQPGSDNRQVRYGFYYSTVNPNNDTQTFTTWKQTLVDVLPAGVTVTPSPASSDGSWSSVDNADGTSTWTWTRNKAYSPSWNSIGKDNNDIYLDVYYGKDDYKTGDVPPANIVTLNNESKTGIDKSQSTSTVQSPAITGGTTTKEVAIIKTTDAGDTPTVANGEYWTSGTTVDVTSNYINTMDSAKLTEMTLQDVSDYKTNSDYFKHNSFVRIALEFNSVMHDGKYPYTFQYKTNKSSDWVSYDTSGKTTATAPLKVVPVQKGSSGSWNWSGYDRIDLDRGEYITDWKVVVKPAAGSGIPSGGQIKVNANTVASYRELTAGSDTSADSASGDPVKTVNTAQVLGTTDDETPQKLTRDDDETTTITNAVPIETSVSAPNNITMSNGSGTATYTACITNLDPSGKSYKDGKLQVVLPEGIQLDETKAITTSNQAIDSTVTVPEIGKGAEVSTTMINDNKQQVVTINIDELQSLRSPETAWDGWMCYQLPTIVLPQAFIAAAGKSVTATSWAWTADSSAAGLPITQTWDNKIQADTYKLSGDQTPDGKIAKDSGDSTITASGGLLIGKSVRATSADGWQVSTKVKSPSSPDWQITVLNAFTFTLNDVTVFDRLPQKDDANKSQFDVTLTGAVTGVPDGSTVQYSKDATGADNGTWNDDPAGAVAFKVTSPTLDAYKSYNLVVPTSVPSGLTYGSEAHNIASGTASYDNNGTPAKLSFKSNLAHIITDDTGRFSVTKQVTGDGASLVGKDVVFSGTYSYPAGATFEAGEGKWSAKNGETWTSEAIPAGAVVTVVEDKADAVTGGTWSEAKVSGPVTIGKDATVKVTVENPITKDMGRFSVTKQVTGDGASLVGKDVVFSRTYSYPAGATFEAGEGKWSAKNGGDLDFRGDSCRCRGDGGRGQGRCRDRWHVVRGEGVGSGDHREGRDGQGHGREPDHEGYGQVLGDEAGDR